MRNPSTQRTRRTAASVIARRSSEERTTAILDTAEPFTEVAEREVKKLPLLRGKSVFNVFFENSTRTRTTFEIAAKRLSADVINLNVATSSTKKGETLLDTVDNLCAMQADMFVVRHESSGAPYLIAEHLQYRPPPYRVVNAGDGRHAHPEPRACWICSPSGTTKRIFTIWRSRLLATFFLARGSLADRR